MTRLHAAAFALVAGAALQVPTHAQSITFSHLAGTTGGGGYVDGTGIDARFSLPSGVARDAAGNIYVADTRNHTIRKITPAGVVSTVAGRAGVNGYADGEAVSARFNSPRGVDDNGNVYVADTGNSVIRRINAAGVVTAFAGFAQQTGNTDGTGFAARFVSPRTL